MIFAKVFGHIEKAFHERYKLSSTIQHKGERGRQREDGLISFLRENLPSAYGVATGEIIPYRGLAASPQCDVIIYDHLHMPALNKNKAVQQVPLEAVYAVIECKSILNATALKDAESKFEKIRSLPRCPSKTELRAGMSRGPEFFLFGYKMATTQDSCRDFVRCYPTDVNVVALDAGGTIWVSGESMDDCMWLNTTDEGKNLYETLVLFYVTLLELLGDIDLGSPNYMHVFWSGVVE